MTRYSRCLMHAIKNCPPMSSIGPPVPTFSTEPVSQDLLAVLVQRLARLGTNLQCPSHTIQKTLIFDTFSALKQLDVICWSIDLLCQLSLSHLVLTFFRTSCTNRSADFSSCLLNGHDVVRSIDFGETLTFGASFVNLDRISIN